MPRSQVTAIGALTLALVFSASLLRDAEGADVTVKALAQGQVTTLPAGGVFINILEFRQVPGGDFQPPGRLPAIVYTLQGTSTITFPGAASQPVGQGEAAFVPLLAGHTILNLEGRIAAGAIAAGLVVIAIFLCAATWLRGGLRRATIVALSILLIAGGMLPITGATSNDYYLIAVRATSGPSLPMPRPDGRVAYTSPPVNPVPTGPYVETLSAITVPPGARYDTPDIPGPQMVVVVEGKAAVQLGDQTVQLGTGGGAFAQVGQTLAIVNSSSSPVQVLDFSVASRMPAQAAT